MITYFVKSNLENHYSEHTIIQVTGQINNSFESNYFTLGVLVDLLKVFNTVDHIALINKLENYGVKEKDIQFF